MFLLRGVMGIAVATRTKQTYLVAPHMSAFEGGADMTFCVAHVCC